MTVDSEQLLPLAVTVERTLFWSLKVVITDRVNRETKAIGSVVRLSIRLSVRLFPLYLLSRLTFELKFLCAWVMTIAHLRLKVKVIGQGQRSVSSANGRGNAETRSV